MSVERSDGPGSATRPNQVPQLKSAGAARSSALAGEVDRLELSARSMEIGRLVAAAQAAPDVRAERVASLIEQIRSGTYQVDSRLLAGRLVSADVI